MRFDCLRFSAPARFHLTRRMGREVVLYTLGMAVGAVIVHEAAHVLAAMAFGARLEELRLGFMGINPSVTLPGWFSGTEGLTVVHYAGGLSAGGILLAVYLAYWMPRYRRHPGLVTWLFGLATLTLGAMQLATGYVEGAYHAVYIASALAFLGPTDILLYGWAIAAVFVHHAICPGRRIADARGQQGHCATVTDTSAHG